MFHQIKHYARVYKLFFIVSLVEATSFRLNFIFLIIMDLIFYYSNIKSTQYIFNEIKFLGPWDLAHFLFFLSFMLTIDSLHMALVSEGFWMLGHHIKAGDLDYILLRPLHSIFSIFFRYVRTASFFNVIVCFILLTYYGTQLQLSVIQFCLILPLLFISFLLILIIEMIMASLMFWTEDGFGINFLRMQMQQISRWPDFIFSYLYQKCLTFIFPILIIGSAPMKFLYNFSEWHYLLIEIFFIFFFGFILKIIWEKALQSYNSASS